MPLSPDASPADARTRDVVALLVSSCTTRSNSEPKQSKERACRTREALIAELNNTGPDLFVLSRRRLDEILLRRAHHLEELSTATTGALRDDLQVEGAFRDEVRRRLLDSWGVENGLALKDKASAAGFARVREYLLKDEPLVGGPRLRSSELDSLARRNDLRLGVLCSAIHPIEVEDGEGQDPLPADVIAIDLDDDSLLRNRFPDPSADPDQWPSRLGGRPRGRYVSRRHSARLRCRQRR